MKNIVLDFVFKLQKFLCCPKNDELLIKQLFSGYKILYLTTALKKNVSKKSISGLFQALIAATVFVGKIEFSKLVFTHH